MIKHNELVLSKQPIAYYPLDADLLNYADKSKLPAINTGSVYTGSNESAYIFFRGVPIVYGLRGTCQIRAANSYISIPSHGMFSEYGNNKSITIEMYINVETPQDDTRNSLQILKFDDDTSGETQFTLRSMKGKIVATIKPSSDSEIKSVSVFSGKANRPKQIVLSWTPASFSFAVDGEWSDPIDISDVQWKYPETMDIYGAGTGGSTYNRFNSFNSVSIFAGRLSTDDINELRNAAWQNDGAADAVKFYEGNFISCTGANANKNGRFTITSNSDWQNNVYLEGISTRDDQINDPQYNLPVYSDVIKDNVTTIYGKAGIETGPSKYFDYTTFSEIKSADVIGAYVVTKGSYSAKEYILTAEKGTSFFGIYVQSNNAYYEFSDSVTGESVTSGLIASSITSYGSTGWMFAGISKRTGEVLFGNATSSTNFGTIYSSLSKATASSVNTFFQGAKFRFCADIRSGSGANPYVGYLHAIAFCFPSNSVQTGFYAVNRTYNITDVGMAYLGRYDGKWVAPTELVADWDGATAEPGALVLYSDGDSASIGYLSGMCGTTPGASNVALTNTTDYGVGDTVNLKITPTQDISGRFISARLAPTITSNVETYPETRSLEFVSYKTNSTDRVEIKDGQSKYLFQSSPYMTIPLDNVNHHQRGANDGVRAIGKSSSVGISPIIEVPSTDTLYGISFMMFIDADPSDALTTSGTFPSRNLLAISGSGGATITAVGPSSGMYSSVNLIGIEGWGRLYVNGVNIPYSSGPTIAGAVKTNCWNHIFIVPNSGLASGRTITFDKSLSANGSFLTSFEETVCYNDFGIFTDSSFPTTNGTKDTMARILAAPYVAQSADTVQTVADSATFLLGDGITGEQKKQWNPLIS